jgi:hypothetical protein
MPRSVQKPRSDDIRFENRWERRDQKGRWKAIDLVCDRKNRNDDAFKPLKSPYPRRERGPRTVFSIMLIGEKTIRITRLPCGNIVGSYIMVVRRLSVRYKNVATPNKRDTRAPLRLVGRLISPLQRPIDVNFKIGAAANSVYAIFFSVSRSSCGSV